MNFLKFILRQRYFNVDGVFVIVSSQAVLVLWCYKNICGCCYCKSILEVKTNPPITEHRKG